MNAKIYIELSPMYHMYSKLQPTIKNLYYCYRIR